MKADDDDTAYPEPPRHGLFETLTWILAGTAILFLLWTTEQIHGDLQRITVALEAANARAAVENPNCVKGE